MNIITHQPFAHGIFSELNRFANRALESDLGDRCAGEQCVIPANNDVESISNDPDGWKLRLELPGYNKEEIKLSIDEHFLMITAETEDEERSFLAKEERRIRISDDVDTDKIEAKLENGILYLKIARRVKAEPKSIVVN